MAKIYTSRLLTAVIMLLLLTAPALPSSALVVPSATPIASKPDNKAAALSDLNVSEFLALTPKSYKELTGKKLSFTQKISLKIAQKKVRKAMKNHEEVDIAAMAAPIDTYDFNIAGFLLGLLLTVIGVLIAYIIDDPAIIKWAWIGFGVWAAIFLLVLIL